MQAKDIPAPRSWGTKKAKAGEYAVLFRVEKVDPVKEQFTVERFAGFDGAVPLFGRQSTISFATWQTNRYHPCDPPAAPVPEMLDPAAARERLLALGADVEGVESVMLDPRAALAEAKNDVTKGEFPEAETTVAILAAHVRWLDAHAAPPVAVFVPPEPVSNVVLTSQAEIADLKAEIVACRADVAGLRSEVRALTEAIKTAVPQMRLFPVAA